MRKRDLVYLHSLLSLVRERIAEWEDEPEGAYDAYESLGVSPSGINRQKDEHERAIRALLDGIEATIQQGGLSALDDWEPTGETSSHESTSNLRR